MSEAMSAQNTYISKGTQTSPATYTEISEVKSMGGPNETADEMEVTHLRSPGGYREFLQSFKDGGELPLELNFLPIDNTQDAVTGLRADFVSGEIYPFQITFPDGSTCTFDAWVKAISNTGIEVGSPLALNVTLRIVGPTTWSEGEGSPI